MLTPFTAEGDIDWDSLDDLTDWYVEAGVAGLFSVSQSSEMFELSGEERIALAEYVAEKCDGSVPVVATGTINGTVSQQARFIRKIDATGVDAVIINVSQLATEEESDEIWQRNLGRLLDATDDVRLGFYECPRPYHRLISPELLEDAAETGRFHFLKDTSCRTGAIREKVDCSRDTCLNIYNANMATLLKSLQDGVAGYSGVAANFYPELIVWLCRNYESHPELASELHQFMTLVDNTIQQGYPVSAKYYLRLSGLEITLRSRMSDYSLAEEDIFALETLFDRAEDWRRRLDLESPVSVED